MKKRTLALLILSLIAFVGCKVEHSPYSFYQVGPLITPALDDLSPEALAKEEVATYLIKNGLVRTSMLGSPIIIEGAIETENDKQATVLYDGMYAKLIRVKSDLDDIAIKHKVTFTFQYQMTKGEKQTSYMPDCNNSVTLMGAPVE